MDGARPVERPVGQAGLQGYRVCVYVCVCVYEVQEEMKGCSRTGCGKGATVRQRFRALSWLTIIMHHMAHRSLGPSPLL